MGIMRVKYSIFIVLVIISLSCRNRETKTPQSTPPFKMVSIPSVLSDSREIGNYIAIHFWDETDFNDSTLLNFTRELNFVYSKYLEHLVTCSEEIASNSYKSFIKRVLNGNLQVRDYLLMLTERVLYDPNSQHRSELMYKWVLETLLKDSRLDQILIDRYSQQLEMVLKNSPGTIANDFSYITVNGQNGTLHSISAKFTLIFFYDPDCHSCDYALNYLKESDIIDKMGKNMTKIAVYTGEDGEKWIAGAGKFSSDWIVAWNSDNSINHKRLYDRRATPYILLLDRDKTVIIKDGEPGDIVSFLSDHH